MTGDDRPAAPPTPLWVRRALQLAASLLVAGSAVWLLRAAALPIAPPAESFSRVRWWTVAGYLVLWSGVHVLRALRWRWLLDPLANVPLRRVLAASFVGFAAIALLPLRTGEAVRPLLVRTRELSGWAATGTIAAERIIDGLFLSGMLLAGLFASRPLDPLPDHIGDLPISAAVVPTAAYAALALFAVAFLLMGLFYARRDVARSLTERVVGLVSPALARWLAARVEHVASGLGFLPNFAVTSRFVALTAVYWLVNSAASWLVGWGAGIDGFSYAEACVTTGVVALGILTPNAPGFFGAYQFSFYAALAVYYPRDVVVGPGAALVLLVYASQMGITLAFALLGAALDPGGTRAALTAEDDAEKLPSGGASG
ncbi:MAG: flippase-like domain-containing protein [Deltaproteobacteria bacterium]|nr:flippase-like domain-containing protein [Deltaproteobacteria bacterium]